jgi:hypothetical protein
MSASIAACRNKKFSSVASAPQGYKALVACEVSRAKEGTTVVLQPEYRTKQGEMVKGIAIKMCNTLRLAVGTIP